jgi:formimidoylglutamate deiminase
MTDLNRAPTPTSTQASPDATSHALFADYAYLPDGWRRNVLLEWDASGTLTHVTADTGAPMAGVAHAAGPVLPGMPNLHSHAFQRAMAGLTEYRANATDNFWSWRDLMYRFAAKISPQGLAAVAQWLYIEMLKAGYTSVCEFHYVHHTPEGSRYVNAAELAERVVDAAQTSGIGMTMLPVLYQYSGFGARAPRADQQRFINTPESLLDLLGKLRDARPESRCAACSQVSIRTCPVRRYTFISPNRPRKSMRVSRRKARGRCNGCSIASLSMHAGVWCMRLTSTRMKPARSPKAAQWRVCA